MKNQKEKDVVRNKNILLLSVTLGLVCTSTGALSKVSAEEASKLGKELTCMGAEVAANADNTIPAFSGKWLGAPPHLKYENNVGQHPVDPYPEDQPIFEITSKNFEKYADKLTEGQQEMFRRYATFRIQVFPGRRDFRFDDKVCEVARKNALEAELIDGGPEFSGYQGTPPFPVPSQAMELLLNTTFPAIAFTEEILRDIANVRPTGEIFWGQHRNLNLNVVTEPSEVGKPMGKIMAYSMTHTTLPIRDRGSVSSAVEPVNLAKDKRLAWNYDPGTRRVRQLPMYGYDTPMSGTSGLMTIDQDRLMNGDPGRYDWKMLGKREIYLPANTYRLHAKDVKYADLLQRNHANPNYIRYELRRVWVLEGTLKESFRHVFGRRVLFIDEDNWQASVSDYYDSRGALWQHAFIAHYYAFDLKGWQAGNSFYHDFNTGGYVAYNLFQERPVGPILNAGKMSPTMFGPEALRQIGN
ncbi:DUF1329 domain-containing protein [Thauera sp. 63]|uniref:DUF1329 domain-containing protein n=1 Tax=Thauera sp. 63 TaxID=497321 RepID=UPI0002D5BC60|nr:DUF1329 domain-containing protein [Thauera sp. 63]